MSEEVISVGDKAYKYGQYGDVGCVVEIVGKTPSGYFKASDGNVYYPPSFVSGSDDWYMSQRGGGKWSSGRLRALTQQRKDHLRVAHVLNKCDAIRAKVGGVDYRSCSVAQADSLLAAWQMVQTTLEDIKQPKKADA